MTLSQARIAGSSDLSPRKPLTIANQPLHLTSDHDSTMCREFRDPELRDFSLLCCPRMSSLVCQAHGTSPKDNQNGIKLCFSCLLGGEGSFHSHSIILNTGAGTAQHGLLQQLEDLRSEPQHLQEKLAALQACSMGKGAC